MTPVAAYSSSNWYSKTT